MARKVIIIRHAKASGGRHDKHLFPKEGAPLSDEGRKAILGLKDELERLGIDVANEPVAISELLRTRQTAELAGFKNIIEYASLNEIETGLGPEELAGVIAQKIIPEVASAAARKLLKYPPRENVWVTHGMLIAGIAEVLDIPSSKLYIPEMASATIVDVPGS